MATPPSLPKPVKRAVFYEGKKFGAGNVQFNYKVIEKSHLKAEEWINANPSIEIIQIETFHTSLSARTVVWYR